MVISQLITLNIKLKMFLHILSYVKNFISDD